MRKTREAAKKNVARTREGFTATQQGGRPEAAGDNRGQSPLKEESAMASREEKILEPSERELLGFILRYGRTLLQFETDSEFYDEEAPQTVAEFIDAALAGDNTRFANLAYQATYDAYFDLYDQGMEQDTIVLTLLNGENRTVAAVTADLSTEKYELTVHNFSDALTTTDSWLVNFVPRAILVYHDKRITVRQNEISRELKTATSAPEIKNLMQTLGKLNEIKKSINIKLGRLKK